MSAELQLFDALDPATEAAMRASIERFGVLVPVVVDQHGRMLDGHHRKRIADELKVQYDRIVQSVADDDEAREIARTLNADRRHLTTEQRREVVADLRRQGHSERAIAGALGVSQPTVHRDIERATDSDESVQPDAVRGLDGRERPPRRPKVFARTDAEQQRAAAALEKIGTTGSTSSFGSLPRDGRTLDLKKAERAGRQRMHESRAAAARAEQAEAWERLVADSSDEFAKLTPAIEAGAVDVSSMRYGDAWVFTLNVQRTETFDGQPWQWPRYSGVTTMVVSDEQASRLDEFDSEDWEQVVAFDETEALAGLRGADRIGDSDVLVHFSWGRTHPVSLLACPAVCRTYDPGYGAFIVWKHPEDTGCHHFHHGRPLFVRRSWGSWLRVEFNDGLGGRERRKVFEHDQVLSTLIGQAIETVDPLTFSSSNLREIERSVYRAMPGEWSWSYARHKTIDRDTAIAALSDALDELRSREALSPDELERRAVAWLQDYQYDHDGHEWREGRCTTPRRNDGTFDAETWDVIYCGAPSPAIFQGEAS